MDQNRQNQEPQAPNDTHSNSVHECACAQVMQHNGGGGLGEGPQSPDPACRGNYCMRAVGLWRRGMSMLTMALGTCRDSGCSLIFLDSGKLWALAPFSTSFFSVRKHQRQRDLRSQNVYARDSHILGIRMAILQPFTPPLHTRLPWELFHPPDPSQPQPTTLVWLPTALG